MVWLPTRWERKFEDMFARFDTTRQRDGHQTDGQTDARCIASRGKNSVHERSISESLLPAANKAKTSVAEAVY